MNLLVSRLQNYGFFRYPPNKIDTKCRLIDFTRHFFDKETQLLNPLILPKCVHGSLYQSYTSEEAMLSATESYGDLTEPGYL